MKDQEENPQGLVDEVSENVSTDIITDLKTGIYSLFVNLVHHLILEQGFENAVTTATDFLNEIILNFKSTIETSQE